MLDYAIEHREAVDIVTQRRDLGLRKFELNDDEWAIAEQLRGVLKVSTGYIRTTHSLILVYVDSKGRNTIFLLLDTQSSHRDSGHGSH